ncbi:MAG: peptide chain release factor 1 [Alphaproteobacteria bacterium]|nr:peptide chain release factor 1 [Alphaproteobacteria bacterium]
MVSVEKLSLLLRRFEVVQAQLIGGSDPALYVSLSREYAELEPLISKIREWMDLHKEQDEVERIIAERDADPELLSLAQGEFSDLCERVKSVSHELNFLLLPKDSADKKSVILEVRAGTGGDEAALFAGDLFRMYQCYAVLHSWKVEVVSASEAELGGYREVIAAIKGVSVYERLKYESGGHRVQRVPVTDPSGRIHTSAVTVAVLPEAETVDVEILDKDLRIDVYRSSGAGGQHVNKTDSAVRITHHPTGIVVAVQDERSQHKNKARAMDLLRTRIYDMRRRTFDEERAADRKSQVGSGDRSQRVRTYNFPQGRVTDHRVNLTLYKLEQLMKGEALDELIDVITTRDQAARLAALEE